MLAGKNKVLFTFRNAASFDAGWQKQGYVYFLEMFNLCKLLLVLMLAAKRGSGKAYNSVSGKLIT